MSSIRKHKLRLKAQTEYDIAARAISNLKLTVIDLLLELLENQRQVMLAEIEYERTHCSNCNYPWSEHDFGVPEPICP